jgi:pimeloyl-ACP methyl ester carboxylesterase
VTYGLVPGAGGSAWYWHLVEAELRARGHEAIAVDLPADDPEAGLAEYVEIVVDALRNASQLILVAQSLGGFTAPVVCERRPVELLLLVNAMIPQPGETAGEWWANTGQEDAKRANDAALGRPADAGFDLEADFFHDVPREIFEAGAAHARPESERIFGDRWPLSRWPDVPTRVVIGRDDRFFPAEFQRRVARERLGLDVDEIPGGHLVALSQPVALVEHLEAYGREVRGPG